MSELVIFETGGEQVAFDPAAQMWSLTAMHAAAGAPKHKDPYTWLRQKQSQEFMAALAERLNLIQDQVYEDAADRLNPIQDRNYEGLTGPLHPQARAILAIFEAAQGGPLTAAEVISALRRSGVPITAPTQVRVRLRRMAQRRQFRKVAHGTYETPR